MSVWFAYHDLLFPLGLGWKKKTRREQIELPESIDDADLAEASGQRLRDRCAGMSPQMPAYESVILINRHGLDTLFERSHWQDARSMRRLMDDVVIPSVMKGKKVPAEIWHGEFAEPVYETVN